MDPLRFWKLKSFCHEKSIQKYSEKIYSHNWWKIWSTFSFLTNVYLSQKPDLKTSKNFLIRKRKEKEEDTSREKLGGEKKWKEGREKKWMKDLFRSSTPSHHHLLSPSSSFVVSLSIPRRNHFLYPLTLFSLTSIAWRFDQIKWEYSRLHLLVPNPTIDLSFYSFSLSLPFLYSFLLNEKYVKLRKVIKAMEVRCIHWIEWGNKKEGIVVHNEPKPFPHTLWYVSL